MAGARRTALCLFCCCALLALLQQASAQIKLVKFWGDEFRFVPDASCNATTNCVNRGINTKWWSFELGDGSDYGESLRGWGNNEQQCYTSSFNNARVLSKQDGSGDGVLQIVARYNATAVTCKNRKTPDSQTHWTSARMVTRRKRSFRWAPLTGAVNGSYGRTTPIRIETRVKLAYVTGGWSALWMLSESARTAYDSQYCLGCGKYGPSWCLNGEIDIVEHKNRDNYVCSNLFWGGTWGRPWENCASDVACKATDGITQGWLRFGVQWGENTIAYFLNGVQYKVHDTTKTWTAGGGAPGLNPRAPFDQPFHLIANLAVGGYYPNSIPDTTRSPWSFQIDWIRAYKVYCTPTAATEICGNGVDDDCDGYIDALDSDCRT